MHTRRKILEAIRQNLIAVKEFASVRNTRMTTPSALGNNFPMAVFYADNESISTETIHHQPRPQLRQLLLTVRVWIMQHGNDTEYAEKQMDIQSARVETVMTNDIPYLDDLRLVATDFDAAEEEPLLHSVTLTYQVDYQTTEMQQEPL